MIKARVALLHGADRLCILRSGVALRRIGFTVLKAATPVEAADCIDQRSDIDILVTDVKVKEPFNGLDLAQLALSNRPRMKIIAVSSLSANIFRSSQRHRYRYLTEPLSPGVLVKTAIMLLRRSAGHGRRLAMTS